LRRRGLKKAGGAGSCNFSTDSCKFLTEEIVGAQNVNFALKFTERGFLRPEFCIFGQEDIL